MLKLFIASVQLVAAAWLVGSWAGACSAAMDQPDEAIDAVEPPPPPPPPPPPALEGGRIFPRNGPRGERCKVCNQMRERATIKAHTESCIYSRKGMLCQQPAWGLLADGQAVNLLVAALPQQTTRLMLTFLDEVEHIYHQCGHHVSLCDRTTAG